MFLQIYDSIIFYVIQFLPMLAKTDSSLIEFLSSSFTKLRATHEQMSRTVWVFVGVRYEFSNRLRMYLV